MFPDGHTSVMPRTIGQTVHHAVTEMAEVCEKPNTAMTRRRGAVAVQVLILMTVLFGFAALTIDVGHLYNVKAELQNAADAAALAGASVFVENSSDGPRLGEDGFYQKSLLHEVAQHRASAYAARNSADQRSVLVPPHRVIVGRFDWDHPDQPLSQIGRFNAVQVTARFAEGSVNGPVLNAFAGILGSDTSNVSATAIAAFNDKLAGYLPEDPSGILPFTINAKMFEDQMVNGDDNFEYDETLDVVKHFPDGTPEVVLYPYKYFDSGADGAGNFGQLNIGIDNQGVTEFKDQILNGVTPEQFEAETGSSELTFADQDGNPTSYQISGNTGLSGGMEDAIATHLGKVVGFFLHTQVVNPGSNAVYTIVSMRFGRLMEVDLVGKPDTKRIVIQPVVFEDPAVRTDPDAPGTGGMVGRLMIVR